VDLEQIVQQILMVRRDLSREDVLKKIYEKKRSSEDYFLDEVAARLTASELGVEISGEEETFQAEIAIKDLMSGLNDVNVVGRVITVQPIQTFSRPDSTEGKIARLQLADKTGALRLVLWNDEVKMVETGKIRLSQIVKVLHAYVREGIDGKLELHVGRKGDLEVAPSDAVESNYPQISDFIDKIGNLTPKKKRANVLGLVHEVFPQSEFRRQNGTSGKVRRLRLRDDTGETTLVFWNEKVDELGDVKKGDCLRIMNARIKEAQINSLELHAENVTQIENITGQENALSIIPLKLTKINELSPNLSDVNVLARVSEIEAVKEFKRSNNETGRLASLHLTDGTGYVKLNLWDEKTQPVEDIRIGDAILLEHAYTRQRFNQTELNLGAKGNLTINPALTQTENLPPLEEQAIKQEKGKIADIKSEGGPFTLEANVDSQPNTREVTTSKNEKLVVTSFEIGDETGKIHVSLWRSQAEFAKDLAVGTKIKLTNIYAKRGFSNLLELVSRTSTSVEIVSEQAAV
jgi:replication factor A1